MAAAVWLLAVAGAAAAEGSVDHQSGQSMTTMTGDTVDRCKSKALHTLGELPGQCDAVEKNKETMGKFALSLLNCQREVEGRSTFECAPDQPLRECTRIMDETVWGQHVQMLAIATQECRAIELAVWRSRLSGSLSELALTTAEAASTLAQLRESQSQMAEVAASTLRETQQFRERALLDHAKLENQSHTLYNDLGNLHELARQARSKQEGLMESFSGLASHVAQVIEGISRIEQYSSTLLAYFFSISSVLFYVTWAVCVHVITTDRRTQSKRLVLFAILAAACFAEVTLRRLWPTMPSSLLWQGRSTVCVASLGVIVWAAVTHRDRIDAMERELGEIRHLLAEREAAAANAAGGTVPNPAEAGDNAAAKAASLPTAAHLSAAIPPEESDGEPDPDFEPDAEPSDAEIDDDDDDVDKDEEEEELAQLESEAEAAGGAPAEPMGSARDGGRRRSMRVAVRQHPAGLNPILFSETSRQFSDLVTGGGR